MAKLDQILAAMAAQQQQIDALMGLVKTTPAQTVATSPQKSAAPAVKAPITEQITGTVSRIAASGKGIILNGETDANGQPVWWNALDALFLDLTVGQTVTLTIGTVTVPAYVAKRGPRAGKNVPAREATRVIAVQTGKAPQVAPVPPAAQEEIKIVSISTDEPCPYCGNGCPKFKYSAQDRQFHCSWMQYAQTTATPTILSYATWISSNAVRVYCKAAPGFEDIGGVSPEITPPASPDRPKRGRPAGSKNVSKGAASAAPAPSVESAPITPPVKTEYLTPLEGMFSAIVCGRPTNGRLVTVIGTGLEGKAGKGVVVGGRDGGKLAPKIAALNVGDRITFELSKGLISRLRVDERAPSPANKNSGKNEPPAPAPQPSNGGRSGRIAQTRKRAARGGGPGMLLNCSGTTQHRTTCNRECGPLAR